MVQHGTSRLPNVPGDVRVNMVGQIPSRQFRRLLQVELLFFQVLSYPLKPALESIYST